MTNTFAPHGFQDTSFIAGLQQNFGMTSGKMAYNASACYKFDPLVLSSGKLAVASTTGNTGAAIAGIAMSFSWISTAQNRRVWQNYYPGSDSVNNADVDVWFQGSPEALFIVQCSNAGVSGDQLLQADVGAFFNFYTGTGSTNSGLSGFSLDYSTKNASIGVLPFVLQSIVQPPISDPTAVDNYGIVGIATLTKF